MDEVIRFTTPTIKSLEKLKKSDLTEEDKKYLAQVIDVYRHLEATAKRLQKAARSKRAGDLKRFDERRRETWDKLKELLGLEADQE